MNFGSIIEKLSRKHEKFDARENDRMFNPVAKLVNSKKKMIPPLHKSFTKHKTNKKIKENYHDLVCYTDPLKQRYYWIQGLQWPRSIVSYNICAGNT